MEWAMFGSENGFFRFWISQEAEKVCIAVKTNTFDTPLRGIFFQS
jgi:hypothetical protein